MSKAIQYGVAVAEASRWLRSESGFRSGHVSFISIAQALNLEVKTESNAPIGDRVEINYPVREVTEEPSVDDKERICAIKIILRTTWSNTRLAVW